jgi:hypothetical protein
MSTPGIDYPWYCAVTGFDENKKPILKNIYDNNLHELKEINLSAFNEITDYKKSKILYHVKRFLGKYK